ncbi:MAG: hypothetical protein A2W36_03705 [Chloroflexi bacterium RBG_16_58_14]|nr:MAG: hypothetical protein A2W36_03705 [Chloroflexi bacterium RBG_16_58_14]
MGGFPRSDWDDAMSTRSILPYSVWLSSFYRGAALSTEHGDNNYKDAGARKLKKIEIIQIRMFRGREMILYIEESACLGE